MALKKKNFITETCTRFSEIYTTAGIAHDLVNKVKYHSTAYPSLITDEETQLLMAAKAVLNKIRERATETEAVNHINKVLS